METVMRPIFLASMLLLAAPAGAQNPAIDVTAPWARATAPNARAGGVFLTLTDRGPADRLLGAATPVAGVAEIHRTVNDNGVMKMLPIDGLDLVPGAAVEFKPGGLHIMLIDLKRQLKPGDSFPLTLTFAKSPPVTTIVTVGAAGAAGPVMDHGHMHVMPRP